MYRKLAGKSTVGLPLVGSSERVHRISARKRYTVTVSGKYRYPPLGLVVPSVAEFRLIYRKLAENTTVYLCLAVLNEDIVFLPERDIP